MRIVDTIREVGTGDAVPNGTEVTIKLKKDGTTLDTATTISGEFTYEVDGNPGEVYYETGTAPNVKRHSSSSTGPSADFQVGEFRDVLKVFGDGYVPNAYNEFAITPGAGLSVNVASGVEIGDGLQYTQRNSINKTFAANSSGSTRIDRVVVTFTLTGADKYKSILAVVQGTPGAGEPALLDTADTLQVEICAVTIANGAATITAGNITDRRSANQWAAPPVQRPGHEYDRRLRTGSGTVSITDTGSTGQAVNTLQGTVTLDAGWRYDLLVVGTLALVGDNAAAEAEIAVFGINTTGANLSAWADEKPGDATRRVGVDHMIEDVLGTGAAVDFGMRVKKLGGSISYQRGNISCTAFPRNPD